MGIVGLLISRGVRFMSDGLNGPTNEEARELLEIRLEEAQAQHAEDLEKLGREMNEVVAQRDEAREELESDAMNREVVRALANSLNNAAIAASASLGAGEQEPLVDAARRVVREQNAAREEARRIGSDIHDFLKFARELLGADKDEPWSMAARRVVAERDAAIARAEKAEAARDTVHGTLLAKESKFKELVSQWRDALGADEGESLEEASKRIVAQNDALAAELAAIRAATGEDPTDEVLHAASMAVPQWTSYRAFRAVYNLGRDAARGEVARMREEVAAANAHAEPAYRTVATDEELRRVFADAEAPVRHSGAGFSAADRAGVAAVAALVRAERHACLVARAVALGCGVNLWSYEDGSKTNVRARVQVVDGNHTEEREVRPADVPATLARLLDEVEAARNGYAPATSAPPGSPAASSPASPPIAATSSGSDDLLDEPEDKAPLALLSRALKVLSC